MPPPLPMAPPAAAGRPIIIENAKELLRALKTATAKPVPIKISLELDPCRLPNLETVIAMEEKRVAGGLARRFLITNTACLDALRAEYKESKLELVDKCRAKLEALNKELRMFNVRLDSPDGLWDSDLLKIEERLDDLLVEIEAARFEYATAKLDLGIV